MMLPKIDAPTYDLNLPISKQKIKFRPFLVKEQKLLLMAVQSENQDQVNSNIKQVLQNCLISPKIDIDELSSVDIEFFFLNLRARSIGEVIKTKYRCENEVETESGDTRTCGNLMDVKFNLLDINVDLTDYSDTIKLTDTVGIKFKFPNFKSMDNIDTESDLVSLTFDIIYNSIDYIFDEENMYHKKETPKKEMIDFLESLNIDQFTKIEKYFANLPALKKEFDVKCNKCGFEHKIKIEGIENFLE